MLPLCCGITDSMTVTTISHDDPPPFPPAKLYLDDIDEIVRNVVAVAETTVPDANTEVSFTCAKRMCDTLQELPEIFRRYKEVVLIVRRGQFSLTCHFGVWFNSYLFTGILNPCNPWDIYRRLNPIFEQRKRHVAAAIQHVNAAIWLLILFIVPVIIAGFLRNSLNHIKWQAYFVGVG